jgi:glycosyltransferase involved in cell wall biosynthesis
VNLQESKWLCCQLGAREHYAVPRALKRAGVLSELITDLWCPPRSGLSFWNDALSDRFHPELMNASVRSANTSLLVFELASRAQKLQGWNLTRGRNSWFQNHAVRQLARTKTNHSQIKIFTYSYGAAEVLRFAKERSWKTVLGQIDPGPAEERIVERLHQEAGQSRLWEPAPKKYWDDWYFECELADRIVVNSEWSRQALAEEGIPDEKITMIPLAFEPGVDAISFQRTYPGAFTTHRPMRVLFLGQINLRKGVHTLLEAVQLLKGASIEFAFVGPVQMSVPKAIQAYPSVKWIGPVARRETSQQYRNADLFVFPTFSDGFGLTQLEAQAWKLPIVTTTHCGEVVQDGVNGVVLRNICGETIANTLLDLSRDAQRLQTMSDACSLNERFKLASLANSLMNV